MNPFSLSIPIAAIREMLFSFVYVDDAAAMVHLLGRAQDQRNDFPLSLLPLVGLNRSGSLP